MYKIYSCTLYGIYFSKLGNGICHQVQLERFGKPAKTLLDSDSHTPAGGGIMPLTFKNPDDYDKVDKDDVLVFGNMRNTILNGGEIVIKNETKNTEIPVKIVISERQKYIMLAGGLLNYTRENA